MFRILSILYLSTSIFTLAWSQSEETCSRVATINFQEVLVDTNTNLKGEGLRYHLEKDELANKYLNIYQDGNKLRWQNAAMGTIGTGLILASAFTKQGKSRDNLLIGGVSVILVNFLVAKTLETANEQNLIRAIDEYNKRNIPKIFFNVENNNNRNPSSEYWFGIGRDWSF